MSLLRGLVRNRTETDPFAADRRLRGRTYAITFERVWTAAVALCGGALPRWSLLCANDQAGIIRAQALTRVFRRPHDIEIRIRLDENGQTRVDVASVLLNSGRDLGANARRIAAFLNGLDAQLGATGDQILDATRAPQFTA